MPLCSKDTLFPIFGIDFFVHNKNKYGNTDYLTSNRINE